MCCVRVPIALIEPNSIIAFSYNKYFVNKILCNSMRYKLKSEYHKKSGKTVTTASHDDQFLLNVDKYQLCQGTTDYKVS